MESANPRAIDKRGMLLVLLSALVFSLAGVLTKQIEASAWTIAGWRGLMGGLLIAAYVAWRNEQGSLKKSFHLGWQGWVLAIVGGLASLAFIFAFKLTYVANVALIYATAPFMAAALGWMFLKEGLTNATALAATLSIVGVAIVVSGGVGSPALAGDGVALLMTFGNALYIVLIRVFKHAPAVFAGGVSGFLLFIVSGLFTDLLAVHTSDVAWLLLFGVSFATAVVLWTEGTRRIPAAESGLLGSAETPFAFFLAWLWLGELPPLASFIGGGLILVAVFAPGIADVVRGRDQS